MLRLSLMTLALVIALALLVPGGLAQIGGTGTPCDYASINAAEVTGVTVIININGAAASGRSACSKLADSWNNQLNAAFASLLPDFTGTRTPFMRTFACNTQGTKSTLKLQATMTPYAYWTYINMYSTCANPAGSAILCSTYTSTLLPPLLFTPGNYCHQRDVTGAVTVDELSAKVAAAVRCTSVSYVDSLGGTGTTFVTIGNRKALL